MSRSRVRAAAVGAACAAAVATLSIAPPASASTGNVQVLSTFLTGAQEVPGPGDANGFGAFAAVTKGDKLCYALTARRIEPATLAHIHAGPRGVAGGIVVALQAPTSGFSADCITTVPEDQNTMDTLTDSELAAIRANPSQFYVNVHNDPFRAGAIRGQLH
ncbi:MAG: CHRD domain-containing protein [Nocardioidaceae bacterium]